MSELTFANEITVPDSATSAKQNIAPRRTVVYQTLMDPAIVRIAGEKKKSKLFNKFLFKLTSPEEIEFVSIEKYYEPYIIISGNHLIDYYRKRAYSVPVDKEAKEVILFGHTFTPRQSFSSVSESSIRLEGEERIVKETHAFLILNRYCQDSKLNQFPSAPSEEHPQNLIKAYKMPEIPPNIDLDVIQRRIVQHPYDISRIVNEELEIDERSVVYTPRFRLTYRCPRIGKQACIEFDAVTLKQVKRNENFLITGIDGVASLLRRLFDNSTKWIIRKASIALERGKLLAKVN